ASVVAIIIGSIHVASNIFDFQLFDTHEEKFAAIPETDAANNVVTPETTEPETSTVLVESPPTSQKTPNETDLIASLLAPPNLPSLAPPGWPPPSRAPQASLNGNRADQDSSTPNLPSNPPTLSPPPLPSVAPPSKGDVPGSTPPTPADPRSNRQSAQAVPPPAAN